MTPDEYRRQQREHYRAAFLEGLGVTAGPILSRALGQPEPELPSIPLSGEERKALGLLRNLVRLGVLRPSEDGAS